MPVELFSPERPSETPGSWHAWMERAHLPNLTASGVAGV